MKFLYTQQTHTLNSLLVKSKQKKKKLFYQKGGSETSKKEKVGKIEKSGQCKYYEWKSYVKTKAMAVLRL